jgi:hypothetical protein
VGKCCQAALYLLPAWVVPNSSKIAGGQNLIFITPIWLLKLGCTLPCFFLQPSNPPIWLTVTSCSKKLPYPQAPDDYFAHAYRRPRDKKVPLGTLQVPLNCFQTFVHIPTLPRMPYETDFD